MNRYSETGKIYYQLQLIRRAEEKIIEIYGTDVIKSPVHLSIGQEAASVAVCSFLDEKDIVYGTYRGHALFLAKGGDIASFYHELFGNVKGFARGKAGSMHLGDISVGMIGTSAIVASSIPNAMGHAFALKSQRKKEIVTVFFGDGAMEEGVFYETLNFCALKRLPILFVCENNKFAIYSKLEARVPNTNFCQRVETYGIQTHKEVDGDIFKMREIAKTAIESVRLGQGPQFIEFHTFRWRDHVGPGVDKHRGTEGDNQLHEWMEKDQVTQLAEMLATSEREQIDRDIRQSIELAVTAASKADFPSPETLLENVYG